MSEYIKREDAVKVIKNYGKGAISDGLTTLDPVDDIVALANAMEWLSTEDVEPVKHGRWVKNIRGNYAKVCSECGAGILTIDYTPILLDCNRASYEREQMCDLADVVKYCPNCGAKMDEVSE